MKASRFVPTLLVAALVVAGWAIPRVGQGTVSAQTAKSDPGRAARMRDHFTEVMTLHEAVIRGDLPAVVRSAKVLEKYEGPTPASAGSAAQVAAIRQAAGQAAAAKDMVPAAYASALMLTACGECHRLSGVMPSAPVAPSPRVGSVVGHMLAHERAAGQMLQGLIVPSNALWLEGTRAFVSAPLRRSDLPPNPERERAMLTTEERIHRIASDAAQATDTRSRASFYSQMLAGCADCHKQQKQWGPKP